MPTREPAQPGSVPSPSDAATNGEHHGSADVWRLPAGVSLLWQSWHEDEVIVYNRASGQTHLLDAFSAAVLRRIEAAPATTAGLAGFFATGFGFDASVLIHRVDAACACFDQLGLAEPDAP